MMRSFVLHSIIFGIVAFIIGRSIYANYFLEHITSEISDLTGTDGRNTQSVPPSSILPSSPSIVNDTYVQYHSDKNETRIAQLVLRSLDLFSGQVNGIFDFETKISIVRFQHRNDIPISGQLDAITFQLMIQND